MSFRRVAVPCRMRNAVVAATFVFLLGLAGGCRQDENPVTTAPELPQGLRFAQGERFGYSRTTIDPFGYLEPSTTTSFVRRVMDTQASLQGRTGVIVLSDSTGAASSAPDTLLLQMGNDGSLYAFGYLADVMYRKDGRIIPSVWNKLVDFTAPVNQFWTVGTSDTAGTMTVYGVFTGETRYFTSTVNGVSMLFQGRRAELTGNEVSINLWISDQPSALAEIAEEPSYPTSGVLYELTSVQGAPSSP